MAYQVFLTDNINVVELDTENIDINSVFSLSDIQDIAARKDSIKSIQFKGTKINNEAFGSFFDLGRTSNFDLPNKLLFNYNPLRSVTAFVYENSNLIFKGSLRISEINIDKTGGITYNTVLTAVLIDLKTVIQDKYLSDLDFSDLAHRYNITNIKNSWNTSTERYDSTISGFTSSGFTYGSGYVYPNIDYGYTGSTINQIHAKNFKPAVYVNEYLNRIFSQDGLSGYTYEVKGSPEFKEQFNHLVIPDCQEGNKSTAKGFVSTYSTTPPYSVLVPSYDISVLPQANHLLTPVDTIVYPPATITNHILELYSGFTNILSVKENFNSGSNITLEMVSRYYSTGVSGITPCNIEVSLLHRNVAYSNDYAWYEWSSLGSKVFTINETSYALTGDTVTSNVTFDIGQFDFKKDEQIAVGIKVLDYDSTWFRDNYDGFGVYLGRDIYKVLYYTINNLTLSVPGNIHQIISFDVNPSFTGDTAPAIITPIPPVSIKQIDFIKSLMKQFNFLAYSRNDNSKHLIFEQYNDYYVYTNPQNIKNNSLDWTKKIDYSSGLKLKSNIDLPKSYLFTMKEDVDYLNDTYKKKYNQIYGQFSFNDQYGLTDTKKLELIFSPTIITAGVGSNRLFPALYKVESGAVKLSKTNIRLAYYNGLQACNTYNIGIYSGATMVNVFTGSTYPQISNYYLSGSTVLNDLNFNQPLEVYFLYTSDYVNAVNSYNNYYVNQVSDLTNPDVTYIECNALLNESDIGNLDLRIPIFINTGTMNGAYFKLLSVQYSNSSTPSKLLLQKIAYSLSDSIYVPVPTPTPTPTATALPTPTPTPTATPTPTPATGYTINWGLGVYGTGGSLDISVNGSSVVSVSANSGGVLSVFPGDYITVTSAGAYSTNPLTAQMDLTVYDNGSYLYTNSVQGSPSVFDSYGPYYPTGDGNIIASASEF